MREISRDWTKGKPSIEQILFQIVSDTTSYFATGTIVDVDGNTLTMDAQSAAFVWASMQNDGVGSLKAGVLAHTMATNVNAWGAHLAQWVGHRDQYRKEKDSHKALLDIYCRIVNPAGEKVEALTIESKECVRAKKGGSLICSINEDVDYLLVASNQQVPVKAKADVQKFENMSVLGNFKLPVKLWKCPRAGDALRYDNSALIVSFGALEKDDGERPTLTGPGRVHQQILKYVPLPEAMYYSPNGVPPNDWHVEKKTEYDAMKQEAIANQQKAAEEVVEREEAKLAEEARDKKMKELQKAVAADQKDTVQRKALQALVNEQKESMATALSSSNQTNIAYKKPVKQPPATKIERDEKNFLLYVTHTKEQLTKTFLSDMKDCMLYTYKEILQLQGAAISQLSKFHVGDHTTLKSQDVSDAIETLATQAQASGFGLVFYALSVWKDKVKDAKDAKEAKSTSKATKPAKTTSILATFIKKHQNWNEISTQLEEVLEHQRDNSSGFMKLDKVHLVYKEEQDYTQLLVENSAGETVLGNAIEDIYQNQKFVYYLYSDITWLTIWVDTWAVIKNKATTTMTSNDFWNETFETFEVKGDAFWDTNHVEWDEDDDCWRNEYQESL